MMWVYLAGALALAGGEPEDVVLEVADGVHVNWTRLTLDVTAGARGSGTESTKAVEQLARREVEVGMQHGSARVQVTADSDVAALGSVPELAGALRSRVSHWTVRETRYHASGRVELIAELALQDLLKPYTLATAHEQPARDAQPLYTGVIVDARGSGAVPAWAPRLLDPGGKVLYEGGVWEDHAVADVPVIYVSDPAHTAALRAGDKPFVVVAGSSTGPDLILTAEDALRFRTSMVDAEVLGAGKVVVVLDP